VFVAVTLLGRVRIKSVDQSAQRNCEQHAVKTKSTRHRAKGKDKEQRAKSKEHAGQHTRPLNTHASSTHTSRFTCAPVRAQVMDLLEQARRKCLHAVLECTSASRESGTGSSGKQAVATRATTQDEGSSRVGDDKDKVLPSCVARHDVKARGRGVGSERIEVSEASGAWPQVLRANRNAVSTGAAAEGKQGKGDTRGKLDEAEFVWGPIAAGVESGRSGETGGVRVGGGVGGRVKKEEGGGAVRDEADGKRAREETQAEEAEGGRDKGGERKEVADGVEVRNAKPCRHEENVKRGGGSERAKSSECLDAMEETAGLEPTTQEGAGEEDSQSRCGGDDIPEWACAAWRSLEGGGVRGIGGDAAASCCFPYPTPTRGTAERATHAPAYKATYKETKEAASERPSDTRTASVADSPPDWACVSTGDDDVAAGGDVAAGPLPSLCACPLTNSPMPTSVPSPPEPQSADAGNQTLHPKP
jgi:hypothetical protein